VVLCRPSWHGLGRLGSCSWSYFISPPTR